MARVGKNFKKANKNSAKGKGKLWKKGQSSSFNPACNIHRQAAKKRGAFGNRGQGNLTESVLAQHNKETVNSICDDSEVMSIGGDTALTAFTNCSLPTFNRFFRIWDVKSFLHKEMAAVLAAVTEVLKANGGKETETEYFAALMTTLNEVVDTDEGVTAVICLLSMLVRRLNEPVLKSQSKMARDTFTKLLVKYMNSDHCALLKNLLTVVYTFLKVKTHWSESSDQLEVVLEFTTHHKPRVRKVAHNIIRSLLADHIPEALTVHPCATLVANFCVKKLENSGGMSSQSRDVFYILSLLQEVICVFPTLSIKKCCETIFKVMTLSNSVVTLCGLKSLHGLYSFKNKHAPLPVDLNARIITALYDYQPNVRDSECLISWLQLMERALNNLFSLEEKLCFSHLPKFFSSVVKCWLNDTEGVMRVVAVTLTNLVHTCINPSSEVFQQLLFEDPINNVVHKMFHHVEEALSYQYHNAWRHVLFVLAGFFEVAGKHCHTIMMKCLRNLADLHDSHNFAYVTELEKALGVAIRYMGPSVVIKAIPLYIDSENSDFRKSWMLPLLRDNIKKTKLAYFIKYFLPLAVKVRNKAQILLQDERRVESKLNEVICSQIWSLLPGFCTEPTDLKECFREVAQILGLILRDDPSLRLIVLSSLRLLINRNLDNGENKGEIAKFSKNYLPILFNLYTTEPKDKPEDKSRLAVYDTIKLYLQITDTELCETFFGKAKAKLLSPESEAVFMQHSLIDLCKAMVPFLNDNSVQELYEYCKPLLTHSNHTVQKKAYGVVKEICCSVSESCRSFVKTHLNDLRLLLGGTMVGLAPATRALRLKCLQHIVTQLSVNEKDAVIQIIPEAVLCTKENSVKARTAAYDLLVEIGNTLKGFMPNDANGALKTYMQVLLAGLGGSPHLMSATILSIGRVMYEFKDELDSDLIHLLIENTCLLLASKSREVVESSLSFLKILFTTIDTIALAQHAEFLVKSISTISEDNHRHFRFKAKEIFTRLVRKFGYEMISKMVPEIFRKQLVNIRKTEARKRRMKDFNDEDSDTEMFISNKKTNNFNDILADSDDEIDFEEDTTVKVPGNRRKKIKAPCIEENTDDIIDLLDPTVNKRLLTIKPVKEVPTKEEHDIFPMSEDGKLIIEEEEKKPNQKKEKDEKNVILSELGATSKKNKRKYEDSDSDQDEGDRKNWNNQGVKKGIHRTQNATAKRRCPGDEFKSKRAGGDMKKGKVEPYAYVPFNKKALNKRKQMKIKGQFKHIVNSAKKGAAFGVKQKSRQAQKKKRNK